MITITINDNNCTGCQKCATVCPAAIFISAKKGEKTPTIDPTNRCIGCAHCTDVCAVGAVEHSDFPCEKIHKIDYTKCPTEEQLMELLQSRRSNRTLRKEQIPTSTLTKICQAAHTAPTASNLQGIGYVVITDPEKLQLIADFTMQYFLKLYKILTNPLLRPFTKGLRRKYQKGFLRMKQSHEQGGDPILRGAVALVLITAHPRSRFAAEDANLAYQNGSLMAQTLGLSQIYTGFVLNAVRKNPRKLEKLLNIDNKKTAKICAGMALGIPKFKYTNHTERKPINLKFI